MDVDPLSVTQTWPLSRLNTTIFPTKSVKTSSGQCLNDVLKNAHDYIEKTSDLTDLHIQHTRHVIQSLCDELEKRKTITKQKSVDRVIMNV